MNVKWPNSAAALALNCADLNFIYGAASSWHAEQYALDRSQDRCSRSRDFAAQPTRCLAPVLLRWKDKGHRGKPKLRSASIFVGRRPDWGSGLNAAYRHSSRVTRRAIAMAKLGGKGSRIWRFWRIRLAKAKTRHLPEQIIACSHTSYAWGFNFQFHVQLYMYSRTRFVLFRYLILLDYLFTSDNCLSNYGMDRWYKCKI